LIGRGTREPDPVDKNILVRAISGSDNAVRGTCTISGGMRRWQRRLQIQAKRTGCWRMPLGATSRSGVDASDVIQEAFHDAWRRLPEYLRQRPAPFFMWLRYLTGQKVLELHRHHLGAKRRDAGRELPVYGTAMPETCSAVLAADMVDRGPRPSEIALREERKALLEEALNALEPLDREVLGLRHFEQLSNRETAEALGLGTSAASKRYLRALQRLKEILAGMPGRLGESCP
jgi:RNA polymerase sigma-70 factor (ECF subfamily)